ncbi:hypothetical protein B0H14DRAFT_3862084 [Mycena olivaceomarginata]|nr:hypothetical protein B0H14DRAFT_3862084 [Mycena olivaceomarginata]
MQFPSVARLALILAAFSLSANAVALPKPICDCVEGPEAVVERDYDQGHGGSGGRGEGTTVNYNVTTGEFNMNNQDMEQSG